jgi:hypothetical protein
MAQDRQLGVPGSAWMELAAGVVHLRPEEAMVEAMRPVRFGSLGVRYGKAERGRAPRRNQRTVRGVPGRAAAAG